MQIIRPDTYTNWAASSSLVEKPTADKLANGFADVEMPPAWMWNWLHQMPDLWTKYLDNRRVLRATWGSTNPAIAGGSPVAVGELQLGWSSATAPVLTDASATYGYGSVVLAQPIANTDNILTTSTQVAFPGSGNYSRMTFDISMSATGANSLTIIAGFMNGTGASGVSGGAGFRKLSADTNWQCQTDDGTGMNTTTQGSGVAPTANVMQSFEVRQFGTGRVEFLINGTIVYTSTTNLNTTLAMKPVVVVAASANTAHTARLGAVMYVW